MATKKALKKVSSKQKVNNDVKVLEVSSNTISEYTKFFSEKNISELYIKSGDVEIRLKRDNEPTYVNVGSAPMAPVVNTQVPQTDQTDQSEDINADNTQNISNNDDNYEKITSPIIGTFYSSPSPDQPEYVSVGDSVNSETVVGIVEAMKMMNELKAGVKGRIVKCLIENGNPVQAGETIFLVEK